MSQRDGGPAFPTAGGWTGMTLRDYFAAKALQGFCADPSIGGTPASDVVRQAYDLADCMLEQREK